MTIPPSSPGPGDHLGNHLVARPREFAARVRSWWRRRVLLHRRGLAALTAAAGVLVAGHALTAPPPPRTTVWVAGRDLPAGTVLGHADLARRHFAAGTAPPRRVAPTSVAGRTLAVPVAAGVPVTSSDLLGPGTAAGYPGRAAVAVRVTDPAVAALLHAGDHVDLVAGTEDDTAGSPGGDTATDSSAGAADTAILAADAIVVAVPPNRDITDNPGLIGRLVVLAVPADQATQVASAAAGRFVTVTWSR